MAANLKQRPQNFYTLDEYFALEKQGDKRYEYWDGEIFCMSGGSTQHSIISTNMTVEIGIQLKGKKCRVFNSDQSVYTPALPPYRYPDVSVVCGKPNSINLLGIDAVTNPTVVFEVLSEWTEEADRSVKKVAYQALESLQEYLLVSQEEPHVTQFIRQGDNWLRKDFGDLTAIVDLPSIGCQLALSDVYEGVEFN